MTPEETELVLDFVRTCAARHPSQRRAFCNKWHLADYRPERAYDFVGFIQDTAKRVLERIEQSPQSKEPKMSADCETPDPHVLARRCEFLVGDLVYFRAAQHTPAIHPRRFMVTARLIWETTPGNAEVYYNLDGDHKSVPERALTKTEPPFEGLSPAELKSTIESAIAAAQKAGWQVPKKTGAAAGFGGQGAGGAGVA